MDEVKTFFKKTDPLIYQLYLKYQIDYLDKSDNLLKSLCHGIVGQQLSTKVAQKIFDRFTKLFLDEKITPEKLVNLNEETLRQVGMSYAKARTLRDLGQKIIDGSVELHRFDELTDDQVIEELVKVKGIGPWTAEMFLMFSLGRPDVFSGGDYGLRKGLQKLYNLEQMPTAKEAVEMARKWSPYRTIASLLIWKSLDTK